MSPQKTSRQSRQSQILDAAMEVFTRLGFNKARMDDIAAEAGVSKGSLYWHFKSKEDIISAVLNRLFQGELGDLVEIKSMDIPADEKLRRFVQCLQHDVQNMQRWQPLIAEFYAVAMRRKSFRRYLQSYYDEYIKHLSAIIAEGKEAGVFHTDDPRAAAFALAAATEGAILLAALGLTEEDWGPEVERVLSFIIQGLQTQDPE